MKPEEKIAVGWIDSGQLHTGFAAHLMSVILNRGDRITDSCVASGPYLSYNRNRMVELFLETDAEWLLSLDSDICMPLSSFDALVEAADAEKFPIMGGKYYIPFDMGKNITLGAQKKTSTDDPSALGAWINHADVDNALASGFNILEGLHSTGIGFALIHREVFLAIKTVNPEDPLPWFKDNFSKKVGGWASDDLHFWEQCRNLNINIAIHLGAPSIHLKQFHLNDDVYVLYNPDRIKALHDEQNQGYAMPHKRISWWAGRKKWIK